MGDRRWKLRLLSLAVATLLLVLSIPACWVVPGLIRREPFYRGLPSSYWAIAVSDWVKQEKRTSIGRFTLRDRVQAFLHLDGKPSVLTDDARALPVLMDLLTGNEAEARGQAMAALVQIHNWPALAKSLGNDVPARTQGWVIAEDGSFFLLPNSMQVFVSKTNDWMFPGYLYQHLYLVDREGNLLDSLSCAINNRLTAWAGTSYTAIFWSGEPDGAQIVLRYLPDEGTVGGNFSHRITHAGSTFRYYWGGDAMSKEPSEWHVKGLCRLAVRDGKLEVVFPDPAQASS